LPIAARFQRKRACEKKHQNSSAGLRRMQRRGICFQRAKLCSLCWRRIQRARGVKKSVILALRYFSAAAGDALRISPFRVWLCVFVGNGFAVQTLLDLGKGYRRLKMIWHQGI
jgi:hypothetical protein